MLHVHILLVAPLGARRMAKPGTDQHQGGVAVRERPHHAGEAIQVNVAGFDYLGITGAWDDAITFNEGLHYVHTGGAYDTYLIYPEIPQA